MARHLTITQAAAFWNVSKATIYRWIRFNKVNVVKIPSGRQRVVLAEDALSATTNEPPLSLAEQTLGRRFS